MENIKYNIFIDGYYFFKKFWEDVELSGFQFDASGFQRFIENLISDNMKKFGFNEDDKLCSTGSPIIFMGDITEGPNVDNVRKFRLNMSESGDFVFKTVSLTTEGGRIKEQGCDPMFAQNCIRQSKGLNLAVIICNDSDHKGTFAGLKLEGKEVFWCHIKEKSSDLERQNVVNSDLNDLLMRKQDFPRVFFKADDNIISIHNKHSSKINIMEEDMIVPYNTPQSSINPIKAVQEAIQNTNIVEDGYVFVNEVGVFLSRKYGSSYLQTLSISENSLELFLQNNPQNFELARKAETNIAVVRIIRHSRQGIVPYSTQSSSFTGHVQNRNFQRKHNTPLGNTRNRQIGIVKRIIQGSGFIQGQDGYDYHFYLNEATVPSGYFFNSIRIGSNVEFDIVKTANPNSTGSNQERNGKAGNVIVTRL